MKIKLDAADKFLEAVALLSVFTTVAVIVLNYSQLPDTIPNHFGWNGEPNQYGSKKSMWAIVAVSVFIYMLTGIISMFPQSFNYPSQKVDKESQYKLGAKLLRSLRASVLFFIALISLVMIQSAKTGVLKGSLWIIAFLFAILISNFIWFALKWKKIK